MKFVYKRLLSFLLVLTMVIALLPVGLVRAESFLSAAPVGNPEVLTEDNYAAVDSLFDRIEELENEPSKKSYSQTQLTDAAQELVLASEDYVDGSLVRNGDSFSWMTSEGIRCRYSPRMREIQQNMTASSAPIADGVYNEPVATKGGWPSGNQVYLIGPFYGYDSDFTDQYKNEATAIAQAIGDTDGYTLYSGTAATIDKVANAVSNGAVVIFDSHGDTDYANGDDYVTGATSSYLCLYTSTGLTTQDYNDGAEYAGGVAYVNGTVIANHMTSNSPGGILWMAICLGMATNTMCEPMRQKGVEVVYGYSQSVTFAGDYLYEETFWDNMCAGSTVATAISDMKTSWGYWDWSTNIANYYGYSDGYSTISAARADYSAFPVVVSDEDAHPGQRSGTSNYGADSLQTVKSTYTLFSQYNVDVQVNNSAYGSADISGNVITAAPAQGYFAQGYTVISGSATVTQNGNSFVVKASSDCTIQINFAPKTAVTVSFSGATVSSQNGYAGDAMSLPVVTAPDGYTFLGWMNAPLTQDTTAKPDYFTSFTPTGNTTLYALYSYVDEDSGTGTGDYIKVTSTPADWSGEYVIVYESGGLILDGSLTTIDATGNYQSVTIDGNTISAAEADPYKFVIAPYEGGYSILGTGGLYIGCATDTNTINSGSSALENSISLDASGNANIIGSGGAYLRYNTAASRFRYYKSSSYSNQEPVALYLKDGSAGTTYYTGSAVQCEHINTETISAVDATCTDIGYTAGVYCNDCSNIISGHEEIAALGHNYETEVVDPTATEQGCTIYTCSNCGDTYTADYVDALGETYTVSFAVPNGVDPIEAMSCNKTGITLPTPGIPAGEYAYTFVGWSVQQVTDATETPVLYNGAFVAIDDVLLYPVYSYTVGGSGTSGYILTDLADISATDKVVITVEYDGTVYAMSNGNGSSSAPSGIIVNVETVDGMKKLAADPAENLLWNIAGETDAFTIYPDGQTDTWLYCNSTNNGVRVGTGSANTFNINSNFLYNIGQNRYIGVYRTNPDWRCYTSINANITGEVLGFYVQGELGTTYYTTLFDTACEHSYTYAFVDGYHTLTCSVCGDVQSVAGTEEFRFKAINLALGSDISINYKAPVDPCFENVYVVFEVGGEETYVYDNTVESSTGRWVFAYQGINPQLMGENVNATIYATLNGYQVSFNYPEYSVLTYCNSQLSKSTTTAETRTLISNLLVYGAKVQLLKNFETDSLLPDRIDPSYSQTPTSFPGTDALVNGQIVANTELKNDTHDVASASLVLSNKVSVKFGFKLDDATLYTYKVTINGSEYTYTAKDLTYDESNGRYYLEFSEFYANEFDAAITVMVLQDGVQVSRALTYTVNTYIKNNADAGNALAEVLKALYCYGEAAKNA